MIKKMKRYIINLGLLLSAILTVFSGLLIQVHFHIGNYGSDIDNNSISGLNYSSWSNFHKFSIILLTFFTIFHIYLHMKWYKTVITKRLMTNNKQVITLTIIFVLATITGFIPWIIDLLEGNTMFRKTFIEIHDKITLILSIYFILHIVKRYKWFLDRFPS